MSDKRDYAVKSSGVNGEGNRYTARDYGASAPNQNSYHYSNNDNSYYYSNPSGSKYYNDGKGNETYTPPGRDVQFKSSNGSPWTKK